jgi:hypothetical protein
MELLLDSHFWVAVAFVVFLGVLVAAGVHRLAWKALGDAGAKVQAQLDQATALKVHLYGSLSATGKGHGTERAALAGLIGHEPATIDPVAVLDKMEAEPDKTYPVKLGTKTIDSHRAQIMDKLGIRTVAELTKFAIREGLTPLDG